MTTPTWLPTARALAKVWTGPPLVQYHEHDCADCGGYFTGHFDPCAYCGGPVVARDPGAETFPHLSNWANSDTLLKACRRLHAGVPYTEDGPYLARLWLRLTAAAVSR